MIDAIEQYYGTPGSIKEMAQRIEGSALELVKGEEELPEKLEKIASEASIIQMVDLLIAQAVGEGASDLHIEPDEDILRVRIRVDGYLHEASRHPMKLHPAIISRLKIMGDLNIAEKRVPQDGRFVLKVGQRDIDIRLSTLPIIFGEKAVLRLLDKSQGYFKIEQLTPMEDTRELLDKTIRRPYGMILLTGPTGSGKTTTAYTLLGILNNISKNIVYRRGSGRVPYPCHKPAPGESEGRDYLCQCTEAYTATGPGYHHDRGDQGQGDRRDCHTCCPYRSSCHLHPSHQYRDRRGFQASRYGDRAVPYLLRYYFCCRTAAHTFCLREVQRALHPIT